MFDPGVQVLDVLSDHNKIDPTSAIAGCHTGKLAHWTNIAVGLEELPQCHIGRLLPEADRRTQRSLEHNTVSVD